jgi:hypothetical protein
VDELKPRQIEPHIKNKDKRQMGSASVINRINWVRREINACVEQMIDMISKGEQSMRMVLFLAMLVSLSACDSGAWVDTVGPSCKNGELDNLISTKIFHEIAKGTCMTSGKSFTGDIQCKGDDVQVKCK